MLHWECYSPVHVALDLARIGMELYAGEPQRQMLNCHESSDRLVLTGFNVQATEPTKREEVNQKRSRHQGLGHPLHSVFIRTKKLVIRGVYVNPI